MWNPFRRTPPAGDFPKPQWPPIQALDSIDLAAKRRDGGVDLIIVASQPIDASAATLDSIRAKVMTYLDAIDSEGFQEDMGNPPRKKIAIVITCDHPIHQTAQTVIDECKASAAARGICLAMQKSKG